MENRLERLEKKVDKVKDDIYDIKIEISSQRHDMKMHMDKIEEHINGDEKIISELQPVLAKLPNIIEMAEKYNEDKIIKKRLEGVKAGFLKFCAGLGVVLGVAVSLHKLGILTL